MAKLTYAALVFALATTGASAQTPQPVAPAMPGGSQAGILTSLPAEALTVTHWYKQNVYDPSDSKIGEIMMCSSIESRTAVRSRRANAA